MLEVMDIRQTFDGQPLLRGVSLTVQPSEIVCLLGASGSGKTTLLRIIAGLEQPDAGDVRINGESVLPVPIHARDFGLMFQDFALFPHLNVIQNVMFGLKMRGIRGDERERRATDALHLVGLLGFSERSIDRLSGGERQRVALARSLAPNPRLLMLDEPMGALDAALRDRLVIELRDIIKRTGLTALYVTHDQQEAFAVADRVAVLNHGRFEQIDTPQALYRHPKTAFVARFLGMDNIVEVDAVTANHHAQTLLGTFAVTGRPEALLFHPDGLRLDEGGALRGQVLESVYRGGVYRLKVRHESGVLLSLNHAAFDNAPQVGESIGLTMASEWIVALETSNA